MNLDRLLDEGCAKAASLTDLRWLTPEHGQGLSRACEFNWDPSANNADADNNVKPEAEIEWGYGNIDVAYTDTPETGIVNRNIPPEMTFDAGPVIVFARDQMNRGRMGTRLVRSIKARFSPETIASARDRLSKLLKWQGIVGTIVLDAHGYENCQDAMTVAQQNPYKRYLKYIIGCSCGNVHMIADGTGHEIVAVDDVADNSIDNFFSTSGSKQPQKTPHCPLTLMPMLARGDLDPEEEDPTMISPMDDVKIPEHLTKGIWDDEDEETGDAPKVGSLVKAKAFFLKLDRQTTQTDVKYADCGKDHGAEWSMDVAENEVDVISAPLPPQGVNLTYSKPEIDVSAAPDVAPAQDVSLTPSKPTVELSEVPDILQPQEVIIPGPLQDELKLPDELPPPDVNLVNSVLQHNVDVLGEDAVRSTTTQDVDARPGSIQMEFIPEEDAGEIDMLPEYDDVFAGIDQIELNDVSPSDELDVDMSGTALTW